MDQTRLNQLIDKYRNNQLNQQEADELDNWFHSLNLTDTGFDEWIAEVGGEIRLAENLFINFNKLLISNKNYNKIKWIRWSVAAACVLAIFSAGTIILLKQSQPKQQIAQEQKPDIGPGTNKAILTLANGHHIVLTGAKNGKLAQQGSMVINKTADGDVVYNAVKNGETKSAIQYNSMSTPRGGQYHLILSDGTNVWLNAASSIKYPTAFIGNSREVEITGEAYFEVAHNAAKPFLVSSNGQTVEVLGTHFNVNAYADEPAIKTTLLEGRVKVSDGNGGALLQPGEQAILKNNTISVVKTDVDDAVAWKNGFTTFDNADIYAVMRQVARWYDVKVTFEGDLPQKHFSGAVSRNANLSDVLKILELSKIHFYVEGKNITVTP